MFHKLYRLHVEFTSVKKINTCIKCITACITAFTTFKATTHIHTVTAKLNKRVPGSVRGSVTCEVITSSNSSEGRNKKPADHAD